MERRRLLIGIALAAVFAAGLAWVALPRLLAALPGRVRQYVPEAVAESLTTPIATLPAPAVPAPATLAALLAPLPAAALALSPTAAPAFLEATTPPTEPTPTPQPTIPPLPPIDRIDGLPIIPQKFNNCGPTNLTIVLNYYGVEVDQFDVAAVTRPNYEDRNVSPGELTDYVNENTPLSAAAYVGGDVALLRALVAAGFPVIIEKGMTPDEATGWMGHYLTVFGYHDLSGHFLTRDTFLGPWHSDGLAAYQDTERYWEQFNGAFIVVYPPEREDELAQLLGPRFADDATMWRAAADRAATAVAARPGDAFAWFNLGASLTQLAALGDPALYTNAVAAFDQARAIGLPGRALWYRFEPYEAYLTAGRVADALALAEATLATQGGRNVEETYLYQGRALALAGDDAGARAAFTRAAELNPGSATGLAAAEELNTH
jgi:tetratricopeptide (TPR) repeat protein